MLGQTYMEQGIRNTVTPQSKRRTIHLNDDVFTRLDQYVAKHGDTKQNIVTQAVMDLINGEREKFLKVYAPQLNLEYSTPNTIFINDNELEKTAVVKAKWNNILANKDKRSLLSLFCELCNSEHCIHVRYSLVLPDIIRLRKEDKLV